MKPRIAKVYKQRGESTYHAVMLSQTGQVIHRKFATKQAAIKFLNGQVDTLTITLEEF